MTEKTWNSIITAYPANGRLWVRVESVGINEDEALAGCRFSCEAMINGRDAEYRVKNRVAPTSAFDVDRYAPYTHIARSRLSVAL